MSFALQGLGDGRGTARIDLGIWLALALAIGPGRVLPGFLGCLALGRRRQVNAGTPRLGQADGDGLFRRARPVLPLADVLNRFANEFARLGTGCLAFPFVLTSSCERFFLWHDSSPHDGY